VTPEEAGQELDIIEVEVDMDMALDFEEAMEPEPTQDDIKSIIEIAKAQIEVDQACASINRISASTQHDNNEAHK
jgi:hypothetical protein